MGLIVGDICNTLISYPKTLTGFPVAPTLAMMHHDWNKVQNVSKISL